MRVLSYAAACASIVLIALTLAPATGDYRGYAAIGALVCSAAALIGMLAGWRDRPAAPLARPTPGPAAPPPPAAVTPPVPPPQASSESDVVAFLATLQEKGRLVDFLQDDITAYSDAQVGAAARVVHQGCKAALGEYVRIVPVRSEDEGAVVTVPAGYDAGEYRLVGRISGQPPFSGTLMHRGWKAESVTLPRVLRSPGEGFPAIAPAEVEIR